MTILENIDELICVYMLFLFFLFLQLYECQAVNLCLPVITVDQKVP